MRTIINAQVCLRAPVAPWLHRTVQSSPAPYFLATPERYKRAYDGLNTHMMYLQPNALILKLLRDKAKTGDFLPYTNTEQDAIETAFSPHASGVTEASRFPRHDHFRGCSGKEKEQH